MVQRMRDAFVAGDRAGFVALAAPAMQARAGVLYDNWRALASAELSHRALTSGGPGDLVVRWRAGQEGSPAEHTLAIHLVQPGSEHPGRIRETPNATPNHPAASTPNGAYATTPADALTPTTSEGDATGTLADLPLADLSDEFRNAAVWSRRPVIVECEGLVSVVSALPDRTVPPRDAAVWAAARLAEARLDAFAWDGSLVVEVPGDLLEFARMGRSSVPLEGVAAYSLSTTREGGYRVVLNPAQSLAEEDLRGVLLHEGVHAVTRAMWLDAPLWAAEGLAEVVATAHWPAQDGRNADLVREAAATTTALPTDDQLAAPGEEGAAAYALAEVAVEAMIERWGAHRVHAWIADWSAPDRPDDAALTDVFLAALPR